MPTAMFSAIEVGIIYAIMALGVYISFRILDFPDLTVDGSFVTGAAVAASLIAIDVNPFLSTIIALIVGFIAGCFTGLLNTVGKINALLSGILMMIALYSINLRIMGRSNLPLMKSNTIFDNIKTIWEWTEIDVVLNKLWSMVGLGDPAPKTWSIIFFMLVIIILIKFTTDIFLKTEIGLALRATGDNKKMIKSFSANTNILIIFGIGLSNSLVALSGALYAQYSKFSDVGMGIGMIVIGLASVIIGEAIVGTKTISRITLAVIVGAIVYRIIVAIALRIDFFEASDMKLITASIVIIALIVPKIIGYFKNKKSKELRINDYINKAESKVEISQSEGSD
ncbi:MAG: ABC transporter permease [Clostridiales bacterium]